MTMNKKLVNAIRIKFKNTIGSPAIKVTLFLAIVLSIILSFLPYFKGLFSKEEQLLVATNFDIELSDKETNIIVQNDENWSDAYDIKIDYLDNVYYIDIKTRTGYDNIDRITRQLSSLNLENYIATNDIDERSKIQLLNDNIVISKIDESIVQMDEGSLNFFMAMSVIFYLIMVLLISRIGVQVAFEKGNKVTELILTSITRKQLFFSQVLSSVLIVTISFIAVSVPMIIAFIINKPSISSDFSFFTVEKIILFLIHLISVSVCLVICAIGISSIVKQAEDANTLSFLTLLPVLVSYIYYILKFDIYRGVWSILNYIPLVSVFPVFGAILVGMISYKEAMVICVCDVLFVILIYIVVRGVYCKNISRR